MPAPIEEQAARRRRLILIENALLCGIREPTAIAIRFGISESIAIEDIKHVLKGWQDSGPNAFEERRELRVRQLEDLFREAKHGYALSKQTEEDESMDRTNVPCQKCQGSGFVGEVWCPDCEGQGVTAVVGKVTIRIKKNKAGDPAFIMAALALLKEINYIEGNHAPKRLEKKSQVSGSVAHDHRHRLERYKNASPEALLGARAAFAKLEEAAKESNNNPGGTTVEGG